MHNFFLPIAKTTMSYITNAEDGYSSPRQTTLDRMDVFHFQFLGVPQSSKVYDKLNRKRGGERIYPSVVCNIWNIQQISMFVPVCNY